jgi:hypothetical protein
MMFAPLEGWRCVKVTDRHTALDYTDVLKDLVDAHFAAAKVIVLIQDLSTHSKASLYEAVPAAEARRWSSASNGITRQNTAAGSTWPNPNSQSYRPNASIAAYPISRSSPRGRRLGARPQYANHAKANWHFTTRDARIKLTHLYLSI